MQVSGQLHGPADLPPGKQEAGWAPEPALILWRRENLLALSGIEPRRLGRSVRNVIAVRTELYRLK
jgi:hypothetical protein